MSIALQGNILVFGDSMGTVIIWNLKAKKIIQKYRQQPFSPQHVAIEGNVIGSTGGFQNGFTTWEFLTSGCLQILWRLHAFLQTAQGQNRVNYILEKH